MGAVEGRLADLGGDCVFSVSRNKSDQVVSVSIEAEMRNAMKTTFGPNDLVVYERTALSEENYREEYFDDVFSTRNGTAVITISISKSVATQASIKTKFTTLSCGNF